jgi:cold shock protein
MSKATGKVLWFNNAKGFGFIRSNADEKDIFVHHSAIQAEGYRTLEEDQIVEFEIATGPKGLLATEVVVLG